MASTGLTILVMLVIAYVALALILYFMQSKFVYDPVRELPYSPAELGFELYDAAKGPKEFIELRGAHNEAFLISNEAYKKSWLKWLASIKTFAGVDKSKQKSV
jgi:hypothetical protein